MIDIQGGKTLKRKLQDDQTKFDITLYVLAFWQTN